KTKLVMSNAQATGTFEPQTPTPVEMRYVAARTPPVSSADVIRNAGHHQYGCGFSVIPLISSESDSNDPGPHTSGMRGNGSGNRRNVGSFAPAISCVSWAFSLIRFLGNGTRMTRIRPQIKRIRQNSILQLSDPLPSCLSSVSSASHCFASQ